MNPAPPKPNILVVTPWFPSKKEPSAGVFILRDVESLSTVANVTVLHVGAPEFFGPDLSAEERYPGFEVVRQPFAVTDYPSWLKAALLIHRHLRRSDVLHTMAFKSLPPLSLLRVSVPWVHTEHYSGLLQEPAGPKRSVFMQKQLRKLLRRPDRMIVVSEFLRLGLLQIRSKGVQVIPNAVPLPEIDDVDVPWDFSELNMLGVGRVTTDKGAHDAVDALIELRQRGRNARLTWIGDGGDIELLSERARQAGVGEALIFRGELPVAETLLGLRAANLFVLPTRGETFGVAIAEAYASGLPIVTGNRGGFTDFLEPTMSRKVDAQSVTGIIVADAIESLISDAELPTRREISRSARAKFHEESRLQQYVSVYQELGVPF